MTAEGPSGCCHCRDVNFIRGGRLRPWLTASSQWIHPQQLRPGRSDPGLNGIEQAAGIQAAQAAHRIEAAGCGVAVPIKAATRAIALQRHHRDLAGDRIHLGDAEHPRAIGRVSSQAELIGVGGTGRYIDELSPPVSGKMSPLCSEHRGARRQR